MGPVGTTAVVCAILTIITFLQVNDDLEAPAHGWELILLAVQFKGAASRGLYFKTCAGLLVLVLMSCEGHSSDGRIDC